MDRSILIPDLDAEGVRVVIVGADHELVGGPVRVEPVIDGAAALELGVGPAAIIFPTLAASKMMRYGCSLSSVLN